MATPPVAQLTSITKQYDVGKETVSVLMGIDFTVRRGDFTAIMGKSGSGKSTLLHILGCLEQPSSGEYDLQGQAVNALSDSRLSALRNRYIGFVFQDSHLLPHATVYENVALPFTYCIMDTAKRRQRILEVADAVGLSHRLKHRPAALSGGERQRVALARALVTDPSLILADEPTGNLDAETSGEILSLFSRLHGAGATIVLVTHDSQVAAVATRLVILRDGLVTE